MAKNAVNTIGTPEDPDKTTEKAAPSKPAAKKRSGKAPAAKKSAAAKSKPAAEKKRQQEKNEIFALDIGTRNVVGIIGHIDNEIFCVDYAVSIPHVQRAMVDGQIEDIPEVARVVRLVKERLEEQSGISLLRVSIAAAGRALRTRRIELSFNVEDKESISEKDVQAFELEAALKAQDELDTEAADSNLSFYCVGHTVVQYLLDDYKIKSLIGHKGKKISVELIAAFLPGTVVESLYSVMDMNDLEVASLTLEPIAAMNVIIPPEVRLINIALVDIGAGTSDIAISQNGSIVAYAMSTMAGDEITEEIVRKYIVDFETAETMKLSGDKAKITYNDILGFEHTVDSKEFFTDLKPVTEQLAANISENIVAVNGQSPAAVFLVGGGSLVPYLAELVAEKLDMPENRVAVGSKNVMKNVSFGNTNTGSPEFVTPIGIGITSTQNNGYDFSVVTLNGKKMRIFDTRTLRIVELLMTAGYKSSQVIGRSGRNITYTLNGEKQILKGSLAVPAEITLNGEPAALETAVKQGDVIEFKPAVSGENAEASISDIAGDVTPRYVSIDGTRYPFGIVAHVNGKQVSPDYQIQNLDKITVSEIETLGDLMQALPFDAYVLDYYKAGKQLSIDYYLMDDDDILTNDKPEEHTAKPGALAKSAAPEPPESMPVVNGIDVIAEYAAKTAAAASDAPSADNTAEDNSEAEEAIPQEPAEFVIILNGERVVLPPRPNNRPHEFIELMAIANIDLDNPPPSGDMILTVNGKDVSFMDIINNGDTAVIRWADQ